MRSEARELGSKIVDSERRLESAFRSGDVTGNETDEMTQEIHALYGRLRSAHLKAHVEMVHVLSREQVHRYNELRGYAADSGENGAPIHGDHHDH